MHIVPAIIMVRGAAEKAVTLIVARRHQSIMTAGRGIFGKRKDRSTTVSNHLVANDGIKPAPESAAMLHAKIFAEITGIEGPEVDDLVAMGIGDLDGLAFRHAYGPAAAGRDCLFRFHVFTSCNWFRT